MHINDSEGLPFQNFFILLLLMVFSSHLINGNLEALPFRLMEIFLFIHFFIKLFQIHFRNKT